jgi:RNA polymerase sigma-70 factor (ECF subfamily)
MHTWLPYNPPMAQPDDTLEELIRCFQDGSGRDRSFQLLFQRYYDQVCRFFSRKGVPIEDCPDLAQEVFLSVYKDLHRLRDASCFPSWFFTIARNIFYDHLEKKNAAKRAAVVVASDSAAVDLKSLPNVSTASAATAMLDREKVEKVINALRELPQQMRRCAELRLLQDCSCEEISAVMGISVSTVKVHLHNARKLLRDKLKPYFGEIEVSS